MIRINFKRLGKRIYFVKIIATSKLYAQSCSYANVRYQVCISYLTIEWALLRCISVLVFQSALVQLPVIFNNIYNLLKNAASLYHVFCMMICKINLKACMINDRKVIVVLPAYNAALTLEQTYNEIPFDIVDDVVMVDDNSIDSTVKTGIRLGIRHIVRHTVNAGYGSNQKSCYKKALELGADIVIMLHPDYQYSPKLIHPMAYIIANGLYHVVLGSRILGNSALSGGMPVYKYIANRLLTFFQNIMVGQKLSEYHTGYRAFSREVLERIDFEINSDDFVFDNEMLSQIIYMNYQIAEVTCPTRYFKEASSINLKRSIVYGLGVLHVSLKHRLCKWGLMSDKMYKPKR